MKSSGFRFFAAGPLNPAADELTTERGKKAFLNRAALVRTAFSSERSLLSWIRTSASLFSFGFAISRFFSYLEGQQDGLQFSAGPRRLGLALVCVGVLVLVIAMIEHAGRLRKMESLGLPVVSWFSLPIATSAGVLAVGVTVLLGLGLQGLP